MTARPRKELKEVIMRGIGVSPGVVMGPAFLLANESTAVAEREIRAEDVEREIGRLEHALIETRKQIFRIQRDMSARTAVHDASVLDAHLMVLDDRSFVEEIISEIRKHHRNVESVVKNVADRYVTVLASVDDDYLRERVVDVKDVARRVIRNINGDAEVNLASLPQKHVIVAVDLAPSETATLRKDMVIGFVTDLGSPTSHTAVMARALEIPAVVGLHDVSEKISTGDEVLIDGNRGILIIRPSAKQLEQYGRVAESRKNIEKSLTNLRHEPAETQDGRRLVLSANAEGLEEIETIIKHGAEGIGLFRSEYLYLSKAKAVSEEEQTEIYTEVARRLSPAPVIIRTLDIGGDKFLPDEQAQREANPFLGCRSIRLSLRYPEQFKEQLRAILRASAVGNVKIMYPMISNAGEVIRANELLEEAKRELEAAGAPFKKDLEVGVMIEIPGAALTADIIAQHVKFFSIGTNDLIQYTLAVDRVNEKVAYLYEPTHPAVLRLIKHTIEAGHRHGIWVGVCGEMAADPLMTPLLVGMNIDELSVAPLAVPLVKDMIRNMQYSQARELAEAAMSCKSGVEVLSRCRKFTAEVAPELLELI